MEREHSAPARNARMSVAAALLGLLWIGAVQPQDAATPSDTQAPSQKANAQPAAEPASEPAVESAPAPAAEPAPEAAIADMPPIAEASAVSVETIPVLAPPNAEPAAASPEESQGGAQRLDDIVVTATKRPQKLRDIPQSITALGGDDLERRGVQNLQDIVKLVPGVNISADAVAPRVTIRGISQSINTSPTVGAIFGNVSFADAYLPIATLDANPFDLETVEVLKGPQGTLFGSSNLNGAIRYVPKAPELGTWDTKYYGQYTEIANAWAPSYGAAVNMPLFGRDDLALRVMGFKREAPGYIDVPKLGLADSNEQHQQGARAMLAWKPGDWDLGFTYAYQGNKSDNVNSTNRADGELSDRTELRLSPQSQAYNLEDLLLAYDFGWAKLSSESSVVSKRAHAFLEGTQGIIANSPIPLTSQVAFEKSQTYSEEIRLSSPEDASSDWHWLVGGLFWKEIIHADVGIDIDPLALLPITLPLGSLPGDVFTDHGVWLAHALTDVSAREYALFGEVTKRFWDRLDITLGGRYYRTLSGGSNVVTGVGALTQGTTDPTTPLSATNSDEIPEHGFSPKVSISLHETDNIMTYATISRGYRVGGVQYGVAIVPNPQSPVPKVFKSDTIWNYEAGLRTEWLDKTLRLDITGFMEDWKNPQYYTIDTTNTSKYLTNVGGVKSTGAEVAIQFITPWNIMFSTTAAYAKTVTTEIFRAANGKDAPVGTPWPFSPKWQTASTLAYINTFGDWNLNSGVTYSFMGHAINDISDRLPVFNYRQLDVQCTVDNSSLTWLPQVNVSLNNALDERGLAGSNLNETTHAFFGVSYVQPRTLNLRLTGHF